MITIDQVEMVMIIMDDDENDDGASWHVWRCGCGLVDGFKYSGLYKRAGRERACLAQAFSKHACKISKSTLIFQFYFILWVVPFGSES